MRREVKLAAARMSALNPKSPGGMPYFASALHSFPVVYSEEVPTMAMSERGVLYINEAFLASVEQVQAVGTVLLHETMHFISGHCARFKSLGCPKDAVHGTFFNIMADFEINSALEAAGCTFPKPATHATPTDWDLPPNKTAEWYFKMLLARRDEVVAAYGGVMGGACGSVGGSAAPWEDPAKEKALGKSISDIELKKRSVARAIREHAERSGNSGGGNKGVPGCLIRWANTVLRPPRVNWANMLRYETHKAVTAASGDSDWSYLRMHRKFPRQHGMPVRPGMTGTMASIRVYIDTSASMGSDELTDCLSEADALFRHMSCGIEFAACDADCTEPVMCASIQDIRDRLTGGGGTSFKPIVDQLTKEGRRAPSTAIIFTDGGGWVQTKGPPHTKVIWVLVGAHAMAPSTDEGPVAWGKIIEVQPEEAYDEVA